MSQFPDLTDVDRILYELLIPPESRLANPKRLAELLDEVGDGTPTDDQLQQMLDAAGGKPLTKEQKEALMKKVREATSDT